MLAQRGRVDWGGLFVHCWGAEGEHRALRWRGLRLPSDSSPGKRGQRGIDVGRFPRSGTPNVRMV